MNYAHTFAGNPLDREDANRRDSDWIAAAERDSSSRYLVMPNLDVPITGDTDAALVWLNFDDVSALASPPPILLGSADGSVHFAIRVSEAEGAKLPMGGARFEESRTAAMTLSASEAGIVAQARAQLDWHHRSSFCGSCGSSTTQRRGGHVRVCDDCGAEQFPRTDPVAIMVVVDGDRCLLGQSRGRMSRTRFYSALAGFIDQGESIEEAVRREVKEEAGIDVGRVTYHSSQPWPFPSSLMIGCHGVASSRDISIDEQEMADVRWFERKEVIAALEGKGELRLPGPIAIAHHLIKAWAHGESELDR